MKKFKGQIYLFLAFTLAGTSVISAKYISGKLGIFTIASVSLFFALLLLLPVCGRSLAAYLCTMTIKNIIMIILQALSGIFLFRLFLLTGLKHTSAVEAGILTGAAPAITASLAMIFLKEHINIKKLIGIISTVFGIIIIQGLLNSKNGFSTEHISGNILILCAAASESVFNIMSRKFIIKNESGNNHKGEFNPIIQTALVSVVAFILCLIPTAFENPIRRLATIGLTEWLMLIWYGLAVTALAYIFWYAGIRRCGAITAAAYSGMMPFASMLLSVFLLGESTGWQQWAGGFLVIAGMIMIGSSNKKQGLP